MSNKRRKTSAVKRSSLPVTMADEEEFTTETRDVPPAHLLFKIESFSMFLKQGIQKCESRDVEAGDYKWRLIIHPGGEEGVKEGDHVSVDLSVARTSPQPIGWEVYAIYNIFLYNQILDNYLCFRGKARRFHAMKSKCGFSKLISKKILKDPSNGYLVDDNCVLGAEFFVIKSQQVIDCMSALKSTYSDKREWKISEFSKLPGVWTSDDFLAGGHRWNITLYPNGNSDAQGRCVSIFMGCVDVKGFTHMKVKAGICIRIKNKLHDTQRSENFTEWFTSSKPELGYREFIPIADMRDPSKGFVTDDCCFLETEIIVRDVVRDTLESNGD